ncbi:MAG: hypothetical protein OXE95_12545 [Chloroflexi bacterium]|nr:hypothetical protein [Chloroflexota bacterium]MCY4248390.1 hypothetical protein [Chloroflexota bacterium]
MLGAICFGGVFGLPMIIWGALLICDRDRSWQRLQKRANAPPRRTKAWDRRQIVYGGLLVALGMVLLIVLSAINFRLQAISPPAPF